MTKKGVLLILPLALIGIWGGLSWHSGKQIAQQQTHYVSNINTLIDSEQNTFVDADVALKKYDRGLFSSTAEYELNLFGLTIPFDAIIEHGPFSLSRLKNFQFTSGSITRFYLKKTPQTAFLFSGDNTVADVIFEVAKSGNKLLVDVISDSHQNPLATIEGFRLSMLMPKAVMEQIQSNNATSIDFNQLEITTNLKLLSVTNPSSREVFNLKDISLLLDSSAIKKLNSAFPLNNLQLSVGSVNFTPDLGFYRKPFSVQGIKISNSITEKESLLHQTFVGTIKKLDVGNKDFGNFVINLNVDKIDRESIKSFIDKNSTGFKHVAKKDFDALWSNIFKKTPSVKIESTWKLKNNEGRYTAQMEFQDNLNDPIKFLTSDLKIPSQFLRSVLSSVLPKIAVTNAMKYIPTVLNNSGYVTMDDSGIQSQIRYQNKQFTINGKSAKKPANIFDKYALPKR